MGADTGEPQVTGGSGTELLREPADSVPRGSGQRAQSPVIPDSIMDLVDLAPEWEPKGILIGGRYEILQQLGTGGCGVTYRACDKASNQDVAIKRLRSALPGAREGILRFLGEAKIIAGLNHPNIVKIHDLIKDDRGLVIVMELLSGGDLHTRVKRDGPMTVEESMTLIQAVGQGLDYAHEQGVVHLDIRPATIMFDSQGKPKLIDLALSRITDDGPSDTEGWMDAIRPQASDRPDDRQHAEKTRDVLALAATLCYMVTGQDAICENPDDLPAEIRPAVMHAMAHSSGAAPTSVRDFLAELGASPPAADICEAPGEALRTDSSQEQAQQQQARKNEPQEEREEDQPLEGLQDSPDEVTTDAPSPEAAAPVAQDQEPIVGDKFQQAEARLNASLESDLQNQHAQADTNELVETDQAREVEALRSQAAALSEEQKYEQAEDVLKQAVELDPSREDLAKLLEGIPQCIRARDLIQLKQQMQPLLEAQQFEQAEPIIRQALELEPACLDLSDLLAELPNRIRHRDLAQTISRAETLRQQGRHDDAIAVLTEALKSELPQPELRKLLDDVTAEAKTKKTEPLLAEARKMIAGGQLEQAQLKLNEAADIDADHPQIKAAMEEVSQQMRQRELAGLRARAAEMVQAQQYEQAETVVKQALQLDPSCEGLAVLLAELPGKIRERDAAKLRQEAMPLIDVQQYERAEPILQQAVELDPSCEDLTSLLNELPELIRNRDVSELRRQILPLIEAEKYERAEPIVRQALELDPSCEDMAVLLEELPQRVRSRDAGRLRQRAEDLRGDGKYEQAIAALTAAIQTDPSQAELQDLLDEVTADAKAQEVAPLLAAARTLMADGELARARVKLDAATRIDPDHQVVLQECQALDEQIRQRDLNRLESHAAELIKAQRYEQAEPVLEQAIELDSSREDIARILAELPAQIRARDVDKLRRKAMPLVEAEQYERAEPILQQAIELDPSAKDLAELLDELPERIAERNTARELQKASELRQAGKYDEAIAVLTAAVAAYPLQADLKTTLDEVTAEGKAQQIDPLIADARRLIAAGDYEQAEAKLTAAEQIDPEHPEAASVRKELSDCIEARDRLASLRSQAAELVEAEQYERAEPILQQAIELDPSAKDLAELLDELPERTAQRNTARELQKANELRQAGKYDEAIAVLTAAVAAYPSHADLKTTLDEVTAEGKAQQIDPLIADAHKLIAAGDYEQAEAKLTAAEQIDPEHPEIKAAMEDVSQQMRNRDLTNLRSQVAELIEAEEYEQAQGPLRQAIELDPSREGLAALLAQLPERIAQRDVAKELRSTIELKQAGKYDEAVTVLTEALESYPARPELQEMLDEVTAEAKAEKAAPLIGEAHRLIADEQFEHAQEILRQAVETDSTCDGLKELLEGLPERIRSRDEKQARQRIDPLIKEEHYEQVEVILREEIETGRAPDGFAKLLEELPELAVQRDINRSRKHAESLQSKGQAEQAIAVLTATALANPSNQELQEHLSQLTAQADRQEATPLIAEARKLMANEELEQAEARLTAALDIDPNIAEATEALEAIPDRMRQRDVHQHHQIALALIEEGQFSEAVRFLDHAIKLDPKREDLSALKEELSRRAMRWYADPLIAKAGELIRSGKLDAALERLENALGLDPSNKALAVKLQGVLRGSQSASGGLSAAAAGQALAEGNYPLAHSICKAAFGRQVVPQEFRALKDRADTLADEHKKRMAGALELHSQARFAEAAEAFASLHKDYQWDSHAAGRASLCKEQINEIVRQTNAIGLRARNCENTGALDGAMTAWRQLTNLCPDDKEAAANLKRHLTRQRKAKRWWKRWSRSG